MITARRGQAGVLRCKGAPWEHGRFTPVSGLASRRPARQGRARLRHHPLITVRPQHPRKLPPLLLCSVVWAGGGLQRAAVPARAVRSASTKVQNELSSTHPALPSGNLAAIHNWFCGVNDAENSEAPSL